MSKVVIVGLTSSGKTCYFYGMMDKMMSGMGCAGFAIRTAGKDFDKINSGIRWLSNTELPVDKRFPNASNAIECFDLDLLYYGRLVSSFEWVDYPGEDAEKSSENFMKILDGADCLLLCVDGMALQGTKDDIDSIVYTITHERDGRVINNALLQALGTNPNGFPPVCIMITKYDQVPKELKKTAILTEIMRRCFPLLFEPLRNHQGVGHRIATISAVSLGKDIITGGRLDPKKVEEPICFASYIIQQRIAAQADREAAEDAERYIARKQQEVDDYKNLSLIDKLFNKKPKPLTEEQKTTIRALAKSDGQEDLEELKKMFSKLPLFIDGEKAEWDDPRLKQL